MASAMISHGALVMLEELNPGSPHFRDGASVRVTGKLQGYSVETDLAIIADENSTLTIDTQHLSISLRIGSLYQFIGELRIRSDNNEVILKARVGRNIDGMDLRLYRQSLQLLKEFQAEQIHG